MMDGDDWLMLTNRRRRDDDVRGSFIEAIMTDVLTGVMILITHHTHGLTETPQMKINLRHTHTNTHTGK